jgi:hypothetical protein
MKIKRNYRAEITYTNNSPDALSFLWLQLDQNLFAKDSRGNAVVPLMEAETEPMVKSWRRLYN